MILFFGTRPGKTEKRVLEHVSCPNCNQKNTLVIATTSNYFHLFWIKLFKISNRCIAECTYCKRGYYENDFTEEMKKSL